MSSLVDHASGDAGSRADARTRVYLYAKDAILRAGVASQLLRSPSVTVAADYARDPRGVALVVTDDIHEEATAAIRAICRSCTPRVVVVVTNLTRASARTAFDAGACRFLLRSEVRADQLVDTIRKAAVASPPSPDTLAGALGDLAARLQSDGLPVLPPRPALSGRQVEILRRMADGESTTLIARDLGYSDSTIKNNIHDIVHHLGATNRVHAVAIALRAQLI